MPEQLHVVTDLEAKALSYPERAAQLTISTPADYLSAGEFVKGVDALAKEVEGSFKPGIEKAHALHKSLIAEMNRHLEPLKTAKATARSLMIGWDKAQEEKRRQEERRLQEEARRREEEAKLAAAIEAEASGQKEEADAIMEEQVYLPPVIVKKDVPKVQGVQFRTVWRFRVTDENKVPREFLSVDIMKLGNFARAMKGTAKVAGVEFYSEKV